ncbi:hypothetical protein [Actinomadura litoris]|uniref:hypothetical protein n=1 Tax=Actinomadura litoris TaxID=2678616 RepID=UPI001FA80D43|nr:hypothetical protein [Actinomadura litoris]
MAARRRAILKSTSGCFSGHSASVASLLAAYSALSVNRHRQMRCTGYDIGFFEQAVRS